MAHSGRDAQATRALTRDLDRLAREPHPSELKARVCMWGIKDTNPADQARTPFYRRGAGFGLSGQLKTADPLAFDRHPRDSPRNQALEAARPASRLNRQQRHC